MGDLPSTSREGRDLTIHVGEEEIEKKGMRREMNGLMFILAHLM
jgi:hypothetical protein